MPMPDNAPKRLAQYIIYNKIWCNCGATSLHNSIKGPLYIDTYAESLYTECPRWDGPVDDVMIFVSQIIICIRYLRLQYKCQTMGRKLIHISIRSLTVTNPVTHRNHSSTFHSFYFPSKSCYKNAFLPHFHESMKSMQSGRP